MYNHKKIMILAPHQDDEVILCGSFLRKLVESEYRIFVVFMTNGDYEENIGQVRMREALEVMRLYHIPKERVIFMGYANEYDSGGPHIYNAAEGQTVCSQFGNKQTYGLPNHPEYCCRKNGQHHLYQRNNLWKDLYDIITEILPDIIFATDTEIHPDHKANSLFFDEVLGKCLKEMPDYRPIVLKKAEYNSAWFGKRDYSILNNAEADYNGGRVYVNHQPSQFSNPYIRWEDRIRFPVDKYARTVFKEDNIVYQALKIYESQHAIEHFDMLMNSDVVFWKRRTQSLTYRANITVSSGDAGYLNDFKLVDSSDIKRKRVDEWVVDKSVWHPSMQDKKAIITIDLEEQSLISEMIIYQEFCPKSEILESTIIFDGKEKIKVNRLEKRRPTVVRFNPRKVQKIEYIIEKCSDEREVPGITEIEVYPPEKKAAAYMKIMINHNFIYDYYAEGELKGKLQIYRIYDDASGETIEDLSGFHIAVTDLEGKSMDVKRYIDKGRLYGKLDNAIRICITDKSNGNLKDEIVLYKKEWKAYAGIIRLVGREFADTMIKAHCTLNEKDYLTYLRQAYYLCKSRCEYLRCSYLKAEFARQFYRMVKNKELSPKETEEGKCFLITGEVQPWIPRYIREYLGGREKINVRQSAKRAVYLIGTPDHYNIGDHIITYATCILLKDVMQEAELIEISMREFPRKLPELQKNVKKDDVLILQGGGNMGNIYWRNERIRREIIRNFADNKIIIFPETIYYTRDCEGEADFAISQSVYGKAKRLTICAREQTSYEIMKKAYPHNKVILVPDIVCYLKSDLQGKREKVKLFFRDDLEKKVSESVRSRVESFLNKNGIDYEYKDMMHVQKGYIGRANRNRIVWNKINEVGSAKLVVTDRLHAMILSVLTGTPCLVIAGYNHKIESTYYTWFEQISYVRLLNDSDNLEKEMEELLNMDEQLIGGFHNEYEILVRELKEEL